MTPPALPIACREIMNWQPLWGLPALPGPGICGSMLRGTVENHQDHGILLRAFKLAATCMRIQCGTALSAIRNKGKPLRRGLKASACQGLAGQRNAYPSKQFDLSLTCPLFTGFGNRRTLSRKPENFLTLTVCLGPHVGAASNASLTHKYLARNAQHCSGAFDFKAVFRGEIHKSSDNFGTWWPGWPCQVGHWVGNLRPEIFKSGRRQNDQCLSRSCADVLIRVEGPLRHAAKGTWIGFDRTTSQEE